MIAPVLLLRKIRIIDVHMVMKLMHPQDGLVACRSLCWSDSVYSQVQFLTKATRMTFVSFCLDTLTDVQSKLLSRLLLLCSSLLYILCNFILSITQKNRFYEVRTNDRAELLIVPDTLAIQIFLAQGIGMGLAMGALFTPTFGIIGHHFRAHQRGLAIGVANTGGSLGGVIYPIVVNNLLNGKTSFGTGGTAESFRSSVRASAGLSAGLLLLANLLIREKGNSNDRDREKPEADGVAYVMGFLKDPVYLLMCLG